MSKYASPFVKDFMSRTNSVIQEYSGEYDATILLNCLLGMVVIPFEMHRDAFESEWLERKIEDFLEEIKSKGRYLDHGKKKLCVFRSASFKKRNCAWSHKTCASRRTCMGVLVYNICFQ